MMQKIPQTLHLGNDTAPRTKPPRATTARTNSSVARLTMPVVPNQMRRVLQSATLCAISLILLAQNAAKQAITPINAPSALEASAAKAQMTRNSQRTLCRAQSAAQSATSLTLFAQNAAKMAITQIGALSNLKTPIRPWLNTTVVSSQIRRVRQRTHAIFLTLLAQSATKLAITQIGALSHL